jgi:hypothetical protein
MPPWKFKDFSTTKAGSEMARSALSSGRSATLLEIIGCGGSALLANIAVAWVISTVGACSGVRFIARGDVAKAEAQSYATELGLSVVGISCAGRDTNNDGYVYCTIRIVDGHERAVECGGGAWRPWAEVSGCRMVAVPFAPRNTE